MKHLRPFIALILILTCTTSSTYGQEYYYPENDNATYSSAYMQSSHTAHWSVYIPIALLVGAAIWFGIADQHHEHHNSKDSQDGLGSLASSKRISSSSHSSPSYSHKSYRGTSKSSSGGYSH